MLSQSFSIRKFLELEMKLKKKCRVKSFLAGIRWLENKPIVENIIILWYLLTNVTFIFYLLLGFIIWLIRRLRNILKKVKKKRNRSLLYLAGKCGLVNKWHFWCFPRLSYYQKAKKLLSLVQYWIRLELKSKSTILSALLCDSNATPLHRKEK